MIGTSAQHLELTSEGKPDRLRVALVAPGIRAEVELVAHYAFAEFGDLIAFFDFMENAWRGWDGDRTWNSLEGELALTARHAGSAVAIVVDMRSMFPPVDGEWSVRAELSVDAGEQLSAIARDLRALVAGP